MIIFANKAEIGAQYLTKAGCPITVVGKDGKKGFEVSIHDDLMNKNYCIPGNQLFWPYREDGISKEAMTMAKAHGEKKHSKKVSKEAESAPEMNCRRATDKILNREYKGKVHTVLCNLGGFIYDGATYKSLTAVAMKITGYKAISGPAFFKNAQVEEPVTA